MAFKPITDAIGFHSTVVLGVTTETRFLEFKAKYGWQKKADADDRSSQAEELARDVAQFANTNGGTLLVGVSERTLADGRVVADAICPVVNVDGFKQWVAQAIRNHLTPATFSHSLDVIPVPGGSILAINIPPSLHLIALWHDPGNQGIEYLYRTDHGKAWMTPGDVERHIMNGSRAMQIRLAQVLAEVGTASGNPQVELTPPVKRWTRSDFGEVARLETVECRVATNPRLNSDSEIELTVWVGAGTGTRPTAVRLPHGLIGEAWKTVDNHVGLCLKVALIVGGDRGIVLEPIGSLL